jgi:hypothetical protein
MDRGKGTRKKGKEGEWKGRKGMGRSPRGKVSREREPHRERKQQNGEGKRGDGEPERARMTKTVFNKTEARAALLAPHCCVLVDEHFKDKSNANKGLSMSH